MKNISLWITNKLARDKSPRHAVSFSNAKTIGVLLHNPDYSLNGEINAFIKSIQNAGKQLEVICFLDKEVNRLYDFPYIELRMETIDMLGNFRDEKVNKFIKTRFDYLYSINNSPFLPFENILSRSQSGIRIGKYFPGSKSYLDLMLDLKDSASLRDLLKQMNDLIPKFNFHE
jgi:hypothetical protein